MQIVWVAIWAASLEWGDVDWGNFWAALGSIITSVAFAVTAWNLILQRRQTKRQLDLIDEQSALIKFQTKVLRGDLDDRERHQAENVRVRTQITQGDWDSFGRRYRKSWRTATVENSSGKAIYNIHARFTQESPHNPKAYTHPELGAQSCWTSEEDSNRRPAPLNSLPPGEKAVLESAFMEYYELELLTTIVRFTDAHGQRWQRDHQGTLDKVTDENDSTW
ncbi:hypothetical protein [Streptomyces canus]|uniref:hypothetical protein n=1 Tax=Streptomyces canus TaxID=58343 RepID=UPI0038158AEC